MWVLHPDDLHNEKKNCVKAQPLKVRFSTLTFSKAPGDIDHELSGDGTPPPKGIGNSTPSFKDIPQTSEILLYIAQTFEGAFVSPHKK